MRRKQKNVSDDSEEVPSSSPEDSGSDSTDYDPKTNNKKRPKRKARKTPRKKNTKKAKVPDDSESDTSPQPGTSGITNNNSSANNSESTESESEDSDYGPVKERSLIKKKSAPRVKSSGLSKKPDNAKKKKASNQSVNGDTSLKSSENHSQVSSKKASNDVSYSAKEIENLAQKLVYFLLVEDQKKYAIKRKAIIAHVFKDEAYSPKLYSSVILKANSILKKTYGMELLELGNQKDSYLIVNILSRDLGMHDYIEMSKLKQQQYGLILYLLTVIFMNDNVISEEDLTKSLKQLGIDLTSKKLHPVFGDVKKYITTELVKQMYLNYECISKEPPKYEYKWGVRAEQEFDKRDLLQFNCQIMYDTTPENWRMQYIDAEKSANPSTNDS